jgi:hypothetical protein
MKRNTADPQRERSFLENKDEAGQDLVPMNDGIIDTRKTSEKNELI